jgi:hypothetical protein
MHLPEAKKFVRALSVVKVDSRVKPIVSAIDRLRKRVSAAQPAGKTLAQTR